MGKISIEAIRQEVLGIDQHVPLLDGSTHPYIYLDNAASTPAFRYVDEKVDELMTWYSSVHRGAGFKSLLCTQAFEEARQIVAEFVDADTSHDCVIFGKNATEALNKLANRLEWHPGDVIICTAMEHHSNDLPWRPKAHIEYVELQADGSLDMDDFERKLKGFAGHVRLVTTTGASNVTGLMPPIYHMAELAHVYGARILVDCAQLAAHRQIRMGAVDAPSHLDFVVLSAHKMYAPFGSGALIGPTDLFRNGAPDYRGGGTIDVVTMDEVFWADPPEREEAGTPNLVGAVAMAASIRALTALGMDAVAAHETDLVSYTLEQFANLSQVTVFGPADPLRVNDRLGVISFQVGDVPHAKVAGILSFEGGMGVRDGCFCAHPYVLRLLGIDKMQFETYKAQVLQHNRSEIPGLVRVSFGCYNNRAEVDQLVTMLQRISAGDYCGDYVVDPTTGAYAPRTFDPAVIGQCFRI